MTHPLPFWPTSPWSGDWSRSYTDTIVNYVCDTCARLDTPDGMISAMLGIGNADLALQTDIEESEDV